MYSAGALSSAACRSQREGDAAGAWDAEWVRAYSRYEQARRARDEAEHERLFGGYAQRAQRARRGDPLGYYKLMGLEPGCTTQEVQARPLMGTSQPPIDLGVVGALSNTTPTACMLCLSPGSAGKVGAICYPQGRVNHVARMDTTSCALAGGLSRPGHEVAP